jgi:hypothetical protein
VPTVNRMLISSTALVCLAVVGCAAATRRNGIGKYIDGSAIITAKVITALINDRR